MGKRVWDHERIDSAALRVKKGGEGFEALLAHFEPYILRAVQEFTPAAGSNAIASEVAQELRLALWEALGWWEPQKGHFAYYYIGALKRVLHNLRKGRVRKNRRLLHPLERSLDEILERADDEEAAGAVKDIREWEEARSLAEFVRVKALAELEAFAPELLPVYEDLLDGLSPAKLKKKWGEERVRELARWLLG